MKYNFNFFGTLLFVMFFIFFSAFGMMNEQGTDNNFAPEEQSSQAFANNTTEEDDDDDDNETCSTGWRPPLLNKTYFNAGSNIPIKFSYCNNGTPFVDENVTINVLDEGNNSVANFTVAKNPHLGIAIQGSKQYHANWKTPKDFAGNFTIIALFSDGFMLTKAVTLV